jgi:glycosyltransferase involved in cell wall biosynthesis
MRLAFVAHNFTRGNGQGRVQFEIARSALEQFCDVTLFADSVCPELLASGAHWVRVVRQPKKANLAAEYVFARAADQALRRCNKDFDIVIGAGYTMSMPQDVSICHFVHRAWTKSAAYKSQTRRGPKRAYQSLYAWCNSRWEAACYSNARRIVAPSSGIRDELINTGVDGGKIELIHHGVDLDEFKPGKEKRQELGLPLNVPLVLFVGDIRTSRKNLDSLLNAVAVVPDCDLVVVGDLSRSPFPMMTRDLGIDTRVHFLGVRTDVPRIMRACDVFVLASRYEPFGMVILEALASGLPTVTTRAVGACDLFSPDCGEVLDDPENIPALAAAIHRLIHDDAKRREASLAAREIAEQNSWAAMGDRYLELFSQMTKSQLTSAPI